MKLISKIFVFLIVFMFVGTSCFYYDNYVKENGIVKVSENKSIKSNSAISMMYETNAGSGEYAESEDNSWPSDGYTFNSTLSKCENGGTISWDNNKKKVIIKNNVSDKCYVYFDVYIADASVDWEYELDDASNTIILTKYIGSEPDVVVHNMYTVDDVVYKNVMMGESEFSDFDETVSGPFANNYLITSIVFEDGVKAPKNACYMFYMDIYLGESKLSYLDVSGLDTSNVTNMAYMFDGCSSLTSLDVSGWDTSNVTNMAYMFDGCSSLTSLDVSGFDTSNVTNMNGMFYGCHEVAKLDVSGFKTDNVTDMSQMFDNCRSLTSLNIGNWDTSSVTNMGVMFCNCRSLTSLNIGNWDTSSVTNMGGMFDNCRSLTSLNIGNWDTSNVTNMGTYTDRIGQLNVGMFQNCESLTSLDVSGWDTSNVTNMSRMFCGCSGLTSLDLSGFDTSNVTNMSYMFAYSSNLTTIYASELWNKSAVESSAYMFSDCNVLAGDVSFADMKVTDPAICEGRTYAKTDGGYLTYKAAPNKN